MSLAIAGLTTETSMTIADTACLETSFPNFEGALSALLTDHPRGL
jgi:3-phosphoshikimate 1-carboxyvinyltransferase